MVFLFTVEDTFMITGRSLILTPGVSLHGQNVRTGDKIKLIKPDKTEFDSVITGIDALGKPGKLAAPIMVGVGLQKEDVPIGTKVWLVEA